MVACADWLFSRANAVFAFLLKELLDNQTTIFKEGTIVNDFLSSTSTQLTYSGLTDLHNHVKEGKQCVFFRNNHFATMCKHNGILYLLVTDLGYANVPEVMWEKLDDISGDTEYADQEFVKTKPRAEVSAASGHSLSPEQLLAVAEAGCPAAQNLDESLAPRCQSVGMLG